jgi:hypothetical protein
MKLKSRNNQGISMTFAMIASALSIIIIASIVRIIQSNAHQMSYLQVMSEAYSMSETGLSAAMNQLIKDPTSCGTANPFDQNVDVHNESGATIGRYMMSCAKRTIPFKGMNVNTYYITVIATRTVGARDYSQRLHSYVEISNVADYLFAVNSVFPIAYDTTSTTDADNPNTGKIYAQKLSFEDRPDRANAFRRAEYDGRSLSNLYPPLNYPSGCTATTPCTAWSPLPNGITLSDPLAPSVTSPVPLLAPLRFPIITDSDARTYSTLAGVHTRISNFNATPYPGAGCQMTDIYPPGYNTAVDPLDCYAQGVDGLGNSFHTSDNRQHVYYSSENIHIGIPDGSTVTIHGQVIFFTTGDITIDGNIISAPAASGLPGTGDSASTAHQAVFIAGPGKSIYISDNFCDSTGVDHTLNLQGLFFATSGTLYPSIQKTTNICTPEQMSLNFTGSIIVGQIGNLSPMFNDTTSVAHPRTYTYMQSLQDHPPPYMPVFTVTYNEFQEVVNSPSMY